MYLKQHVLLILHRHNLRNSSQEKDVAVFKFARKAATIAIVIVETCAAKLKMVAFFP